MMSACIKLTLYIASQIKILACLLLNWNVQLRRLVLGFGLCLLVLAPERSFFVFSQEIRKNFKTWAQRFEMEDSTRKQTASKVHHSRIF